VTWALILVNVAIHVGVMSAIQTERQLVALLHTYALYPVEITAGQDLWTLVTSAFLHAGWGHLLGNMLFLWIYGDNLEDALGRIGFLAFYIACAVLAGLAQWGFEPYSAIPTIGASGAIAGVMGGYLLLFPRARVDILLFLVVIIRIIPVPAWLVLALWFVLQIAGGLAADPLTGGVAYWAHAGGFAAGAVLMLWPWIAKGGPAYWRLNHGHPPHPEARWSAQGASRLPVVRRRR
jgi:membrane associated rhomboid family serine protease